MTRTNQEYRALFLSALMVLSVMVGTVAFAGTAAAAPTLNSATTPVQAGENVTINFDDDADGGANQHIAWFDADNDGTWDAGESHTNVTHTDGETGVTVDVTVPSGTSDGSYQVAITETSTATAGTTTAGATSAVTVDSTAPSVGSAIESAGNIEIAFSENVMRSDTTAALDANNITIYRDGVDVTSSATLPATSNTNGRMNITGLSDVLPNEELIVNIDSMNDSADNQASPGNVTVQVTGAVVDADATASGTPSTISVYQGTQVAINFELSRSGSGPDEAFERFADSRNQFSGSTGTNSFYVVFDSSGKNLSATHSYRVSPYSGTSQVAAINLRDLGLTASADSTSITDADDLTVSVGSNAGDRSLDATLYDASDDSVVSSTTVTTDSATGDATVDFGAQSTGTYYVTVQDVLSGVEKTTADVTVEEAASGQASFGQNTYSTFSGDIADIKLSLSNTDQATVTIGSNDAGYVANVTVTDGDGDGTVTLQWNTYRAGETAGLTDDFSVADSDDEVDSVSSGLQPTSAVDTGSYDLDIRAGTSASASAQAVSVVAVEGRSTTGVTSWTVPEERSYTSVSDIQTGVANGNVTMDDNLAMGDQLVLAVEANGIEGLIEAQAGGNDTVEFFNAVNNAGNLELSVSQLNPRQNRNKKAFQLAPNSTTVVQDPDNATYYLVIDLGTVAVNQPGSNPASLADGDEYRANFTVLKQTGFQGSQEAVTDDFKVATASVDHDSDPVRVLAEDGQTVSGTSNLAPGTTLRVQLQSTGDTSPRFIKSTQVLVTENNTWSGEFNFSEQSNGDTFSSRVSDTSRPVSDSSDGEVVDQVDTPTETPRVVTVVQPSPTPREVTRVVTQEVERTVIQERTVTVVREVTQTPGQPGFGIAVAIVALLAAALLAVRRRD